MANTAPSTHAQEDDTPELDAAYGRLDHVLSRLEKSFQTLATQKQEEPDLLSFASQTPANQSSANQEADASVSAEETEKRIQEKVEQARVDDQEIIDMLQQLLDEAEQKTKDLKAELADAHGRIARLEDQNAAILDKVDASISHIESVLEVEH